MSKQYPDTTVPKTVTVEDVRSDLLYLLDRLDDLGLFQAGAHLSMSIHCLDAAAAGPRGVESSSALLS